jgi:hypothetical protein
MRLPQNVVVFFGPYADYQIRTDYAAGHVALERETDTAKHSQFRHTMGVLKRGTDTCDQLSSQGMDTSSHSNTEASEAHAA